MKKKKKKKKTKLFRFHTNDFVFYLSSITPKPVPLILAVFHTER